jgi:hypothetical protein
LGLPAELHTPISRFGSPVHLSFTLDLIFELGNQRENAHDKLPGAGSGVDGWIVSDFEDHPLSASSEMMR